MTRPYPLFPTPAGFTFWHERRLYRQVNRAHTDTYRHLMESGLYEALTGARLLVPHKEMGLKLAQNDDAYRVIRPKPVPFVSYPYEWCFSQLKAAALVACNVQKHALAYDMTLANTGAYSVQFDGTAPVFIDTLALRMYQERHTWETYRRLVRQFLAPLALMSTRDVRLGAMLRVYDDGIPLSITAGLLPLQSRIGGLATHIHNQARDDTPPPSLTRQGLVDQIDSLIETIESLTWTPAELPVVEASTDEQEQAWVRGWLNELRPRMVWDLNTGNGTYSRIATEAGARVIAWDANDNAVERLYRQTTERSEQNLMPLRVAISNPTPPTGWANSERVSFEGRANADVMLALSIIQRLVIREGIPLKAIAAYFAKLAPWLLVDFVPSSDPQVISILRTPDDIPADYTLEGFEAAFGAYYEIIAADLLGETEQRLYVLQRIDE